MDPYDDLIRILETQQAGVANPESRAILTEKLEMFSALATQRAEAVIANQGKFQPYFSTPIPIPVRKMPEGIDNEPVIPTIATHLIITNAWRKYTAEKEYVLWAGSLRSDPTQGIIYYQLPDPPYGFVEYYAPPNSGVLRIVSSEDFLLKLTSESGIMFYFDVLGKTFVDQDGRPIPVPTQPLPAPTAYP